MIGVSKFAPRVPATQFAASGRPARPRRGIGAALVAFGILFLAPSLAASAPRSSPPEHSAARLGSPALRVFRDLDGLPQNTVHAIAVDRLGRLWVGTQDGAATYDGRRWTSVDLPQRHETNHVRALLAAADGSLWFGTQAGGLAHLIEGRWETFAAGPGGLPASRVNALAEVAAAGGGTEIWVATHGGLACRHGSDWRVYGTADGLPNERVWVVGATTDAAGAVTIWAGTEDGLARMAPGSARFVAEPGFPTGSSVNSLLETTDADGRRRLWAGTYGSGLYSLVDGGWRRFTRAEGMPNDFVTSLAPALESDGPASAVWVGTDGGGAVRVGAHVLDRVDSASGISSDAVYAVLETPADQGAHALWIGTRNGGLVRLTPGRWRSFAYGSDHNSPVNAIVETDDPAGRPVYWLGTDGDGLHRLDGGNWTVFDARPDQLPNDSVQCLLATRNRAGREELWVGTRNGGLALRTGDHWKVFDVAAGALPNNLVHALLETTEDDGETALWIGTRGGLTRRRGETFANVPLTGGPADPRVQALFATRSVTGRRVLWVGTTGGLGRLEAGSWRWWGHAEGLPNPVVQALHRSHHPAGGDHLWIGTDGGGVALLDLAVEDTPLQRLDRDTLAGLPNEVIYQILEDGSGRIYLLTNRGVARLTPTTPTTHDDLRFDVETFNHEDGLPLNQGNRGAGLVDRLGRIWVGTVGGAAILDPRLEAPDRASKPMLLSGTLPESGRAIRDGERLAHDEAHLIFDFALLSFFREGETRYRSQMVGLEAAPSSWSADSDREFTRLPKGDYRFRVWGRDYAGNVTGPREIGLHVDPAPWETGWAYLLAAATVLALLAALVRTRLRALARRERDLSAKVDARTRQLREANDLLIELSYVDALTAIANRRRFDEVLELEWRRAVRSQAPLALVMIDIDSFKSYNDAYGHQKGDSCLRSVAAALADGLVRAGDMVGRYGGEEFGVILPGTDLLGAARVAEALRARVEQMGIEHRASSVRPSVTISCGVTSLLPEPETDPRELLHRADLALYRAKQRGRNRVATEPELPSGERRPPSSTGIPIPRG